METPEIRKKSVPGTRDLINQLRQISKDLEASGIELETSKENLKTIYASEKSNSPKAKILGELQQLNEKRNILKGEKSMLLNTIDSSKARIATLKESMQMGGNSYNTIEKIDNALQELDLKLITASVTQKEEIEISNKMSTLMQQKNKISENEVNHKLVETLDASIKENKAKLSEVCTELNSVNAEVSALKEQLDALVVTSGNKSSEVTRAEAKIATIKKQREELFNLRNSLREKIHVIEEEFAKFENELLIQKELESKKDEIRKNISQFKSEKENLLLEQGAYDPKIFDSLIYSVGLIIKSGSFTMNIDLATQLMKNGVKIPNSLEGLKEVIEILKEKKTNSVGAFENKKQKVSSTIAAIDAKIEAESQKLNDMPETDFEVLKKGGVKVGGFKNKVQF